MKMLSAIPSKKKDKPLLPQTIESPEESTAGTENPVKLQKSGSKVPKKKTDSKMVFEFFIDGLSALFYVLLFLVLWLAPGILLGFSGGSYYQYKRMAPYVNQDYKLLGENWKLSTELWKVESILAGMDNLLVYERGDRVEKWVYNLKEGSVECNYIPQQAISSTSEVYYADQAISSTSPAPEVFYAEYETYDYSSGNLIKDDVTVEKETYDYPSGNLVKEDFILEEDTYDLSGKLIKEDILEEEVIKDEAGVIIQGNIVIAEEDIKDDGVIVKEEDVLIEDGIVVDDIIIEEAE